MKRLCVFAHWDKDNIIDDYVIFYLKALKEVCSTIIFVSDCDLETIEKNKLTGIAEYVLAEKHGEYDFGSYKRGYFYAKDLGLEFEELLLANDSLYGPFSSLATIFSKMNTKHCDYWGLTRNTFGIKLTSKGQDFCYCPHIQSYFLLLKQQTFRVFEDFIKTIKPEKTKEEIVIKYEMGLNIVLKQNGFKNRVFINKYKHTENCTLRKCDSLIKKYKFPFVKTSVPRQGLPFLEIQDWKSVIPPSYPENLIEKQLQRLSNPYERTIEKMEIHDRIVHYIFIYCPFELFLAAKFLDRKVFSTFRRFFRYIFKYF